MNDCAFLKTNEIELIYTKVDMATVRGKCLVGTVLVDTLKTRSMPEAQIVLAYRGNAIRHKCNGKVMHSAGTVI